MWWFEKEKKGRLEKDRYPAPSERRYTCVDDQIVLLSVQHGIETKQAYRSTAHTTRTSITASEHLQKG